MHGNTLFLFGSQALSFDEDAFQTIRSTASKARHRWILDIVTELPDCFENITQHHPKFLKRFSSGLSLLKELSNWFKTGKTSLSPSTLPNIILTPLVVISHLIQYVEFLETAKDSTANGDDIYFPYTQNAETLGFCTGLLSALAVSSSSNREQLEAYGAVAIRIGMLLGMVVDVGDSLEENGPSKSLATTWHSAEEKHEMLEILRSFPQAYVSVYFDENRATVTTSAESAPTIHEHLRAAGLFTVDIGLLGRFHWAGHCEDAETLIKFCEADKRFKFPDPLVLALPTRSNAGGDYITHDQLHSEAIRSILLEPLQWYESFRTVQASSLATPNSTIISFGFERCVPPSLFHSLSQHGVSMVDFNQKNKEAAADNKRPYSDNDIAIVGMSCKVAGADDLEEFWDILCKGKSQHQGVPSERFTFETVYREIDPKRTWYGNFINDYDKFDHKFFKKSPREAESMDPQQRQLLQIAYQAVEQSGYFHQRNPNTHIGCYIGVCCVDYENNLACYAPNAFTAIGHLRGFIAGKVSHYFGWTGPGLTIDTACSSSAVAIHQACQAILNGECTAALAGGTHIMTSPLWFQNLAGASFLSRTGQCKPFDSKADGYCRGEGVATVFLKKLSTAIEDGNQIFGVIAGTAVQQNQNCTPIVVPNLPSLSNLFKVVVNRAVLKPNQITVVEAHGTGTAVGDPVEYASVHQALAGQQRSSQLFLGSVKGLIGHCECTSGIISLIKILLMIQKGMIPPQASFDTLNPAIKVSATDKIHIPTKLITWDTNFRAALINNYGASGSNASMVIMQAPDAGLTHRRLLLRETEKHPFWFSALDNRSLLAYITDFRKYIKRHGEAGKVSLADLSFNVSRQSNRSFPRRLLLSCRSLNELDQQLAQSEISDGSYISSVSRIESRPVILCFGGQVSKYIGLDRQLYENVAVFRKHLNECNSYCISFGAGSIFPAIFQRVPIEDIVTLQTSLFALQYCCAKSWIDAGAQPVAVLGHSFGELTALCISEVLSLQDTLKMIVARARIIRESWGPEKGAMMAIEGDLDVVEELLREANRTSMGHEPAVIACFNGPRSFTLAGSNHAIDAVEEQCASAFSSVKAKKINVTNAFHSTLVDPLMASLSKVSADLTFKKPSTVLARCTEHPSDDSFSTSYVADHMRMPVFFNHALQRLVKSFPQSIWLEAGSNSTVTNMAHRALGLPGNHFQSVNITTDDGWDNLTDTTLGLWRAGLDTSFWAHSNTQTTSYIPLFLPTYQFQKSRHWLENRKPPKSISLTAEMESKAESLPDSLLSFLGYQDKQQCHARFRINTMIPEYDKLMAGHVIVYTAPIYPATMQMELVIEGLKNIVPFGSQINPQIHSVENQAPICVNRMISVWLDLKTRLEDRNMWSFRISSTGPQVQNDGTTHSTGSILLRPVGDLQTQLEFARYERITGYKRCVEILNSSDVDEIIQGRSIYKMFADIVDYQEQYRGLQKLVGKGQASAGRVVRKYDPKSWFDGHLSDCFCQVVGIWLNCMTEKDDSYLYIAKGFEKWVRSSKFYDGLARPESYEVLAYHQGVDNNNYLSDIFVFNPDTGELLEIILGFNFVKVPRSSIVKLLSRLTNGDTSPIVPQSKAVTVDKVKSPGIPRTHIEHRQNPQSMHTVQKLEKERRSPQADVLSKLISILADLVGIQKTDITINSVLADIGVDSLLAMEVVSEIERSFTCVLSIDDFVNVTDMAGMVRVVQTALEPQIDSSDVEDSENDKDKTSSSAETEPTEMSYSPVEIYDLLEYISDCLGISKAELTSTAPLRDLGVDSLLSMEIRAEIAQKFGLELEDSIVLEEMTTEELYLKMKGDTLADPTTFVGAGVVVKVAPEDSLQHIESTPKNSDHAFIIPLPDITEAFNETKALGDHFLTENGAKGYAEKVLPKQTQLCVLLTLETLEQIGCNIRSLKAGETLTLFQPLPEHVKLMSRLLTMLETESGLIKTEDDVITRTDCAYPTMSSKDIMEDLQETSPLFQNITDLISYVGSNLGDALRGKTDGIKLIFGCEKGRNLVSGLYGDWLMNISFYKQMEDFITRLASRLPPNSGPLKILEMGAGTGGTTKWLVPFLANLPYPVEYTFSDLAPSLVAAARRRFNKYSFMTFRTHDIEKEPSEDLLGTYHCVIASNAVHATHSLVTSAIKLKKALLPNGILIMLEMIEPLYWVDMIFGLFEGWWLFDDGRTHALTPPARWKTDLQAAGFGHVDWSDGVLPENTINKFIIAVACEQRDNTLLRPRKQAEIASHLAGRQAVIDSYVHEYTCDFVVPAASGKSLDVQCSSVVLTGATGSVGSHIVASLAKLPGINKVVCLNRQSIQDPKERQLQSFISKGIILPEQTLSKLLVLETDLSKPKLGLPENIYEDLLETTTHIIHNAWVMSIKRPLKGFESQFRVMRNLIDFARDVSCKHGPNIKVNFQFISSIATVGHYPLWKNEKNVPEERLPLEAVLPIGYGDAKYICELMLDNTLHQHPDKFRTSTVRLGQVGGSKISGYWNPVEHLSFLFKSSQTLKKLPSFQGLLSWTPVDDVAGTLVDLALTDSPYPVYNIDNPVRQRWEDMLPVLADALNITQDNIIPFEEWIQLVRKSPKEMNGHNPATALVDFLDENFLRMSCGGLLLDSTKSREHSETLRAVGPISPNLTRKFIQYWKSIGFMS